MSLASHLAIFLFMGLLVVTLLRRRPPVAGSEGFLPRFAAFAGTFLATGLVLLPRLPVSNPLVQIGTLLTLMGTAFAIYALVTLGRSLSMLSEARKLVTGGPYSLVRHPLYLGEQIALLGLTLQFFSIWAVALLLLQFVFQFYRMGFEEQILNHTFPEYSTYARGTYRLVPLVY